MSSIIKVDQIQKANGATPTAADLGINVTGTVLQYQYKDGIQASGSGSFSTSATTLVDFTDHYVDITPTSASSILVWKAKFIANSNVQSGYARFAVRDTNANSQWSSNTYMGAFGYDVPAAGFYDVSLGHTNTAGTTNTMRLQLQVQMRPGAGGGTFTNSWSDSDTRTIEVFEIAG